MDLFLNICVGAGLSVAAGLRPFLPAALVGLLARNDLGLDLTGSSFAFIESWPFILAMLLLAVVVLVTDQAKPLSLRKVLLFPTDTQFTLVSVVLGAILFAAALDSEGYAYWSGLAGGAVLTAASRFTTYPFFHGVRQRLESQIGHGYLNAFAEFTAISMAVLAILIPPVTVVYLIALVYLRLSLQRRSSAKYEGLRVLK